MSRPEFVEFRTRITRIVESLPSFRNVPQGDAPWPRQERVEVKLESDGVTAQFVVSALEWETVLALVHDFQEGFGRFDPLFMEPMTANALTLRRSRRIEDGFSLPGIAQGGPHSACQPNSRLIPHTERFLRSAYLIEAGAAVAAAARDERGQNRPIIETAHRFSSVFGTTLRTLIFQGWRCRHAVRPPVPMHGRGYFTATEGCCKANSGRKNSEKQICRRLRRFV